VLVRRRSRFLSSVLPSYLFKLSSLSRSSPPPPSVLPAREQVTGQVHPPGSCAGQASPTWIRFSSSPLSSCSLFSFLQQGRRAHLSRSWTKLPCPPLGHRPFSLFFSSACNVQSLPLVLILSFPGQNSSYSLYSCCWQRIFSSTPSCYAASSIMLTHIGSGSG
jgi:hypothetical protein